jgi:TRAP-type C4-dicarboxylate transport system substrate-binding protein
VDVRQEVVVRIERDDQELLKKFRAEAVQVNEQIAGLVAADMNRSLEAYGVKIVQAMNQAFSKAGSQASAKIETQAAQRGAAGAN